MIIDLESRPEDCQQKNEFKMKTLNIQTIFVVRVRKYPKTTRSKT